MALVRRQFDEVMVPFGRRRQDFHDQQRFALRGSLYNPAQNRMRPRYRSLKAVAPGQPLRCNPGLAAYRAIRAVGVCGPDHLRRQARRNGLMRDCRRCHRHNHTHRSAHNDAGRAATRSRNSSTDQLSVCRFHGIVNSAPRRLAFQAALRRRAPPRIPRGRRCRRSARPRPACRQPAALLAAPPRRRRAGALGDVMRVGEQPRIDRPHLGSATATMRPSPRFGSPRALRRRARGMPARRRSCRPRRSRPLARGNDSA